MVRRHFHQKKALGEQEQKVKSIKQDTVNLIEFTTGNAKEAIKLPQLKRHCCCSSCAKAQKIGRKARVPFVS
jgi:hypothetical protein